MRRNSILLLIAVLIQLGLSFNFLFAQDSKTDSINVFSKSTEIIEKNDVKGDSIQSVRHRGTGTLQVNADKNSKLDSIRGSLENNDIVKRPDDRIDSIQHAFNQHSDSLRRSYNDNLGKLNSLQSSLQKDIDSLTTLKLPSGRLTKKLDSLNSVREKTKADFEGKMQSIKEQATTKLRELDLPPEAQEKLNAATQKINSVSIASSDIKIPSLNDPTNSLLKDVPGFSNNNPLQTQDISKNVGTTGVPGTIENRLPNAGTGVAGVTKVSAEVGEYSKEAGELAKGNMDQVKSLPKTAEEKAVNFSGVKKMEEQTKGAEQYRDLTSKVKDQDALKKELKEQTKKAAVNHFAGKEEQLKAAMQKMSKYKQKYTSISSIKDLKKKPRNEMHDRPLIERIVPGLAFQIQKRGEDLLIDFNPYAGYKFTKSIRAGLGWNQRIGYNIERYSFSPNTRIYGPRAFGEFKLGKGFSPRAEFEVMNTNVPPLTSTIDPENREWVSGAFAGMKKEYKLFKSVKGTAIVMARLYGAIHKSPYADVVNVRFGFEFPMKKKVRE